jgi:exopolysaccharide production protein ExoZ
MTINNPMTKSDHRITNLDQLRGIAILAVICIHVSARFPSNINLLDFILSLGAYGVQLFFFISAFTMCHVWNARKNTPDIKYIFYKARVLRIIPLFWMAIIFYGLERAFFHPTKIPSSLDYILTAFSLHTFYPTSFNNVVPGGWSIGIEMTFYLVFPFLMGIFFNKPIKFLALGIVIYFSNKIFFEPTLTNILLNPSYGFTPEQVKIFVSSNFLQQAPIFLAGCFLYHASKNGFKRRDILLILLWIAGVIFLKQALDISGLFFLHCLLIGATFFYLLKNFTKIRWLANFGKRSYGMYLIHFFVIDAIAYILVDPNRSPLLTFLLIIFTSIISYFIGNKMELTINPAIKKVFSTKN